MKIGVIGVGGFGINHVRTLSEMGALASIAELRKEVADEISSTYDVPGFTDPNELISSRPDGIVVATPAATHFHLAKSVLEAGIPCLVEKPMTLDVKEGIELTRIAKKQNTVLMVGHLLIYQSAIQFIKSSIDEGLIGNLVGLHQERLNLGKARDKENALWSLGVHDVAVALYLIGQSPIEVKYSGQSSISAGIDDDSYLHLKFGSGVQATIHSSWLWPELRRRLTMIGDKGMLVFDEPSKNVLLVKKSIGGNLASIDHGTETIFESSDLPLKNELNHFLHCIKTKEVPLSDGLSGVEVMKVLSTAASN